jgi:hypothetical protein
MRFQFREGGVRVTLAEPNADILLMVEGSSKVATLPLVGLARTTPLEVAARADGLKLKVARCMQRPRE